MTYDARAAGAACDRCPLNDKRPVGPLPAKDPLKPKLIIIGMNPGRLEENRMVPFCGPSGRMLTKALAEAGFDRSDAHVTNAALCRCDNDADLKRAVPCCAPRLARELADFDKSIPVLTLGAEALRPSLGKAGIMKARGFVWTASEIKPGQIRNVERRLEKLEAGLKELKAIKLASGSTKEQRIQRRKRIARAEAKVEPAKDSVAIMRCRKTFSGRVILPTIHPAFILRGADGFLPVLRLDIRRAVRWVQGPGFPLEDEGAFIQTNDPKVARAALAKMGNLVNVDIETDGNDPMTIGMTCVGVCDVAKVQRFLEGKTKTIPKSAVVMLDPWNDRLRPVLRDALRDRTVLTHNGPAFDEITLARHGITFSKREDTLIAHYAFASDKPKSLAFVSSIYNSSTAWKTRFKQGSEEKGVAGFGVKKEDLAKYCQADVVLASLAWLRMQRDLAPERHVYEHDMKHATLCAKMQINGLLVDEPRKKMLSDKLRRRAAALLGEMRELLGRRNFMPSKPNDIRKALFSQLKAPTYHAPPTPTGLPATNVTVLETMRGGHNRAAKLADLIIRWRSANDSRSEYLDNIKITNGRVHAHWRSYGTTCMPAGELILTNRGYLQVEDVKVGDQVITHQGRARKVEAVTSNLPEPIYKVTLTNGLTLRTNAAHPYLSSGEWRPASTLRIGQRVTVHSDPEQWKPLEEWPYQVSSWGRIRGRYDRIVKLQAKDAGGGRSNYGHLKITLKRNGARERGPDIKDFGVHQLVIQAFGAPGEGEVCHIDGTAWNNTIRNLTWGSSRENKLDMSRHGTARKRQGRQAKLTQERVDEIRAKVDGDYFSDVAFAKKFGTSRELVRDVRLGKRWMPEDHIEGKRTEFFEAKVASISIEPPEVTYGLSIEEDESHVTGGIVTHNTGRPATREPNILNITRGAYCKWCGVALLDAWGDRPAPKHGKWKAILGEDKKPLIGPDGKPMRTWVECKKKEEPQPEDQLRDIYICPPGHTWVYFDLAQVEMRFAAFLSGDKAFMASCEKDVHAANARVLFASVPGALEALNDPKGAGKRFRDLAKNCGFAISYLAEADKLFEHLLGHGFDIDMDTCQDAIDSIHSTYWRYYEWAYENIELCKRQGYLRTPFLGRKRWMGYHVKPTEVPPFLISGGTADVMNERLGIIDARMPKGVRQILYQYDSAIYETPIGLADEMEKLIDDVWAEPVRVPATGIEFIQPIDRKRGMRWSDFG